MMFAVSGLASVALASGLAGITFWIAVIAGFMLAAFTGIIVFLTLSPRYSETWAERLGENTDREEAVDYREAIVDETEPEADENEPDEPEAELESAESEATPSEEPEAQSGEPAA